MQTILKALHDRNLGDGASVLGVLISIIGFIVTIIQVARSKNATEQATKAVAEVRQKLSLQNVAGDLAALMSDVEEIKALHRIGAWAAMPSRCDSIRKRLLLIKGTTQSLTPVQKKSIQGVIEQFKTIGQIVEIALDAKEPPKDVRLLNKVASEQSDKLTAVLIEVQKAIGA